MMTHTKVVADAGYGGWLASLWPAGRSSVAEVFAVLDAARDERIHRRVEAYLDQKACLYEGALTRELQSAAPYLLRLFHDDRYCHQLFDEGWGHSWGVYVVSSTSLNSLRRHFRQFMVVRGPSGARLIFRWYDPRVLRAYLPTCNVEELRTIFGSIDAFIVEGVDPNSAHRFSFDGKQLTDTPLRLDG